MRTELDGGRPFDWGKAAADYAKHRDIYPQMFYDKILDRGLCRDGQSVLDLGTGSGVLPRNLYRYGARWTGIDPSEAQIAWARRLSSGTDIRYLVSAAEDVNFPKDSFDVVTACQCFWYFDHERLLPRLLHMLRPLGSLLILYMAWLPFEDPIAAQSERLILKYSPQWSGAGESLRPIPIPDCYDRDFACIYHEEYPLKVHFSRESWHGRVKASRGISASLSEEALRSWKREHRALLAAVPEEFDILHYAAAAELKRRK